MPKPPKHSALLCQISCLPWPRRLSNRFHQLKPDPVPPAHFAVLFIPHCVLKAATKGFNDLIRRHVGVQAGDHDFGKTKTAAKLDSLSHNFGGISLFTKPRSDRIAYVAAAFAKVVIENMAHAQTSDDFFT